MYKPRPREEYIASCRYYRGEGFLHEGVPFWQDERQWVEIHFSEEGLKSIKECVHFYKAQGLEHFMVDDGTPFTLKAFLLATFQGFTCGSAESFKGWYKYNYLQMVPPNSEKE